MPQSYAGKFARIDLTGGKIEIDSTPKELKERFLGGVGIGGKIMWDETDENTDALSPENRLIFLTGPVQGTLFPQSARYVVVSRSPLTGWWAHSSAGGFFGPELKYAGFDFLIIQGKSPKPVYIYVENGIIQIRDASHIWGKMVPETSAAIEKELGDMDVKVACIGPAGEKGVKFACIMSDYFRAVGRTGLGCVMGSKNLKAVAVRGTGGLHIANPEKFEKFFLDWWDRYTPKGKYWEYVSGMRTHGTFALTDWENAIGRLPTKNHWTGYFENAEETIGMEPMRKRHYKRHRSCFCCGIQCKYVSTVKEGKWGGTESEGPEYETVEAFTSNFLSTDTNSLIRANYLCNIYGMDTITAGHVISFAYECFENGIFKKTDTGGRTLQWGEDGMDTVNELLEAIATGKDEFSRLLGLGSAEAARRVGGDAWKYAITVNNLEASGQDPRPHKSMGLTYAINVRGADHLTSISCIDELGYKDEAKRRYKKVADIICDRWDERYKGFLVTETEELNALCDAALLCKYGTMWPPIYYFTDYAKIISSLTGMEQFEDMKELSRLARCICHIRRMFNIRLGWTKKNDSLHPRIAVDAMPTGPAKGQTVNLEVMLKEYYQTRKYDWKTGYPTPGELKEAGLHEVVDDLKKRNKLKTPSGVPKSGRKWIYWWQR
ncbi:MAG: aldehyde ferredoxin oxidoreductase family protein [Elusimicrobiota bacterium]